MDFDRSPFTSCFLVMTGMVLFVSCFLIGGSVDSIHPNNMAFHMDRNRGDLRTDELIGAGRYGGGRKFLGLGHKYFPKFPRTQMMLRFTNGGHSSSISCLTSEGLGVTVGMSFQYHLLRDARSISEVYYNFGSPEDRAWEPFYIAIARQATRQVISEHSVRDLWRDRSSVANSLRAQITSELSARWANVTNVQLLNLDIPSALQSAIEDTTVAEQRIARAGERKQATQVEKITERENSKQSAIVQVVNARRDSEVLLLAAQAEATAANLTIAADAAALAAMRDGLLMETDEVLQLHLLDSLRLTPATSLVSLKLPEIVSS